MVETLPSSLFLFSAWLTPFFSAGLIGVVCPTKTRDGMQVFYNYVFCKPALKFLIVSCGPFCVALLNQNISSFIRQSTTGINIVHQKYFKHIALESMVLRQYFNTFVELLCTCTMFVMGLWTSLSCVITLSTAVTAYTMSYLLLKMGVPKKCVIDHKCTYKLSIGPSTMYSRVRKNG